MAVFVLDRRKRTLMPCSEKRARKLLARGRARVHRRVPFSIRIIDLTVSECVLQRIHGFQTGDRVIATVPTGKKAGVHVGRIAVRVSGSFNLQTGRGVIQGISHRFCKVVQRADGYGYTQAAATAILPRPEGRGFSRRNG